MLRFTFFVASPEIFSEESQLIRISWDMPEAVNASNTCLEDMLKVINCIVEFLRCLLSVLNPFLPRRLIKIGVGGQRLDQVVPAIRLPVEFIRELRFDLVSDNVIDLEVGQTRKSDTPARYFRDKSIF